MFKPFLTKWPFLFKLRLFLGSFLIIVVLIFLYFKVVPFGRISYEKDWSAKLRSGKGFISDFKPAERLDTTASDSLTVLADPVYFSLFTPRAFDQARVTVKYRDRLGSSTPVIELGVLKDKVSGSYELQPLQNDIVDQLRFSWPRLADDGGRLILQSSRNYSSEADFFKALQSGNLKDCPGGPLSCLAVYNYDLDLEYHLPDYVDVQPVVISQPLRGAHQFYVYFKKEPWRLSFDFVDLNLDKGQDPITVNVFRGNKLVASKSLGDNNPTPDNGRSENKNLTLSGIAETAGVYKVEIKASDDIIIAKTISSSDKLAFINHVWPVSGPGNLTLFTDVPNLQVMTLNPASLGKIDFGGQKFSVDKTDEQFVFSALGGTKALTIKKDDLVLEGNGLFSFSANSLFNPSVKKIDRFFADSGSVRYVLADYERPIESDGIKTSSAVFSLKNISRENGKYTFLISVPGLNGKDSQGKLEITEIKIDLQGKTLWQKIFH